MKEYNVWVCVECHDDRKDTYADTYEEKVAVFRGRGAQERAQRLAMGLAGAPQHIALFMSLLGSIATKAGKPGVLDNE